MKWNCPITRKKMVIWKMAVKYCQFVNVCLCQLHSCRQKRFPIEMLLAQLSCQCSLIEFVCPTLNGAYRDCRINRTRIDCRQCPTVHKTYIENVKQNKLSKMDLIERFSVNVLLGEHSWQHYGQPQTQVNKPSKKKKNEIQANSKRLH